MLAADRNHDEVLAILADLGANLHMKDTMGWNALHWAAEKGFDMICHLLLERKVNVDEVTKDGGNNTALTLAVRNGFGIVVQLLVQRGAALQVGMVYFYFYIGVTIIYLLIGFCMYIYVCLLVCLYMYVYYIVYYSVL